MGERGYQRVRASHEIAEMRRTYREIYKRFAEEQGLEWTDEFAQSGEKADQSEKELVQSGNVR